MARNMTLPKIGVNMTEIVLGKWLVSPGDAIQKGDAVLEAETDKATQEIYATESGVVEMLLYKPGDTVQCHEPILTFKENGESEPESAPDDTKKEAPKQEPATVPESARPALSAHAPKSARIRISPLARKLAKENGLLTEEIRPEAPGMRIVKNDVFRLLEKKPRNAEAPAAAKTEAVLPAYEDSNV